MQRRQFNFAMTLGLLAATALGRLPKATAADATTAAESGATGVPFDFDTLTARARELAASDYVPPAEDLPEALAELDYDSYRRIAYDPERSVWRGNESFALQAFHMGWLFRAPVNVFSVDGGMAEPVGFSAADFIYREPLDAARLKQLEMPGVAGFRVLCNLNSKTVLDELVAFQGASYFRALGKGSRYGLSARGLAIDTATGTDEEFPRFSDFYIEKPARGDGVLTVHALLDGPSVTGAYRFVITPGETTQMEVTKRLFLRRDVARLGIAPLTSMFLFNGINRHAFDDYRESVHDSEGLKIVRANGEELWRSLNNPRELASSFFAEESPRAFGLYQRSRAFEQYQDAGAHYEMRPSLLVEPLGDWGRGTVTLIEIPTELEVNDNIVLFWVPEGEAKAGQALEYRYRLTWGTIAEDASRMARVVDVSAGDGGVSGVDEADKQDTRKFVVDFEGGLLGNLPADAGVEALVEVSAGEIVHATVAPVETTSRWRMVIDLKLPEDTPVEMKAHLAQRENRISEFWLVQWRKGDEQRS